MVELRCKVHGTVVLDKLPLDMFARNVVCEWCSAAAHAQMLKGEFLWRRLLRSLFLRKSVELDDILEVVHLKKRITGRWGGYALYREMRG